jgi:predicted ABC-type sugar transport system permease subunit
MVFFQFMTGGVPVPPGEPHQPVLQNSYIVIMALGMLLVIVAGHIDLSVGSVRLRRRPACWALPWGPSSAASRAISSPI